MISEPVKATFLMLIFTKLTEPVPSFNLYDEEFPIYNYPDILPTAKLTECNMDQTTVASGCMIGRSIFLDACLVYAQWLVIHANLKMLL